MRLMKQNNQILKSAELIADGLGHPFGRFIPVYQQRVLKFKYDTTSGSYQVRS